MMVSGVGRMGGVSSFANGSLSKLVELAGLRDPPSDSYIALPRLWIEDSCLRILFCSSIFICWFTCFPCNKTRATQLVALQDFTISARCLRLTSMCLRRPLAPPSDTRVLNAAFIGMQAALNKFLTSPLEDNGFTVRDK